MKKHAVLKMTMLNFLDLYVFWDIKIACEAMS